MTTGLPSEDRVRADISAVQDCNVKYLTVSIPQMR